MSQPLLDLMTEFLGRFRQYREAHASNHFSSLQGMLARFTAALPQLQAAESAHDRLYAPEFNVFRILRLGRREVSALTPMLGELLNPRGSHAQGTLFLEAFFAVATEHHLLPPRSVSSAWWRVQTEKFCGSYGNIDLVVSCPALGYLLVIANKVDAQEGDRQLERFFGWIETQRFQFPHRQLVFLTPTGRPAITHAGLPYVPLSYREVITEWLCKIEGEIAAPAVRQLVLQYREIVQTL